MSENSNATDDESQSYPHTNLVGPIGSDLPTHNVRASAAPIAERPPRIGAFGNYELLREIAHGGMGVVYQARHFKLDRIVALKMILNGEFAAEDAVQRFYREAEAAAALDHPNIVHVFEVGRCDGQHFFSMSFIEGPSLADLVSAGPLPPREAAELMQRIASAIAYAHGHGVIHRDLKPGNVLLERLDRESSSDSLGGVSISSIEYQPERAGRYEPKVTDFGLAKRTQARQSDHQTTAGHIVGTPAYMAPEQALGQAVGCAADIYGLGAMLYCLLTGRPPFQAATSMDTLLQVVQNEPVPPRQLNPHTPRDLETITLKCLQKDPARRYPSAQVLAEELGRFVRGEPIHARPVGRIERTAKWVRRHPAVAGLGLLVVVSVILGLAFTTWFALESRDFALLATKRAGDADAQRLRAIANAAKAKENAEKAEENAKKAKESEWQARLSQQEEAKARKTADAAFADAEKARTKSEHLAYAYQIMLSRRDWQNGNLDQAYDVLDRAPWHLRGWEYHYLLNSYNKEPMFTGHRTRITSLAFSSDGQFLASGDEEGVVKLWELWSGQELYTFDAGVLDIRALAFSGDAKVLATGNTRGEIKFWNTDTGIRLLTIPQPNSRAQPVHSLAFSADGKLISGGEDKLVKIWDSRAGTLQQTLGGHTRAVRTVACSPDSQRIIAMDDQGALRMWSAAAGTMIPLQVGNAQKETPLFFDQENAPICWTANKTGKLMMRNALTGMTVGKLTFNVASSKHLVAGPGGREFAHVDSRGDIVVLNQAGARIRTIAGLLAGASHLAMDSSGNWVAGAGENNSIRVCHVNSDREARHYRLAQQPKLASDFHVDADKVVVSGFAKNHDLGVRSLSSGLTLGRLKGHTRKVTCRAFSPDGKQLASGSDDKTVRLWDLDTLTERMTLQCDSAVNQVHFAPDGRWLASVQTGNRLVLWDLAAAPAARSVGQHDKSFALAKAGQLAVHPKRAMFAFSGADPARKQGSLMVYDCAASNTTDLHIESKGMKFLQFLGDHHLLAITWTPARMHVISTKVGGEKNTIRLLDLTDFNELVLACSPDRRYLAASTKEARVAVWETQTGEKVMELPRSTKSYCSLGFTPDSNRLVSAETHGVVKMWDLVHDQPVLELSHSMPIIRKPWPSFRFADAGRKLILSDSKTAVLWDRGVQFSAYRTTFAPRTVMAVALRPDGKQFAAATDASEAIVYDAVTGARKTQLKTEFKWGQCIAFTPDSLKLLVTPGKEIKADAARLIRPIPQASRASAVAISADGAIIATGNADGVFCCDAKTGALLFELKGEKAMVHKLDFSADGKRLAASYGLPPAIFVNGGATNNYEDVAVVIWDLVTQTRIARLEAGKTHYFHDIDLDATGRVLALATADQAKLWDVDSKQFISQINAHRGKVLCVGFSPDDRRLVTGGSDRAVRIWDIKTNEKLFEFKGHAHDVNGAVFSADGEWVLTRSMDQQCFLFKPTGQRQSFHWFGNLPRQNPLSR